MSTLALDSGYFDDAYAELTQMDILLDDDPLLFGPKRLNGKIAESRRMLSRCERLFVQGSQYLSQAKRELRSEALTLDLSKKHLLANDPIVRAERSVSDRDAAATMQLRAQVSEVNRLEQMVADLDDLLSVIKAKRSDLRDIQGRLRDQIRLCQAETGLGDRWGSQVPGARPIEDGLPAHEAKDVADLIASLGIDEETHLKALDTPEDAVDEDEVREHLHAAAPSAAPALPPPPAPEEPPAPTVEPVVVVPPPVDEEGEEDDLSGLFKDDEQEGPPEEPIILKATSTVAEVDRFLNSDPEPKVSRRQMEAQDGLDIDDILSHFG